MYLAIGKRWVRKQICYQIFVYLLFVYFSRADQQKLTVRVSKDAFTETVVAEAVAKKSKSLRITREQQIQLIDEHQKNYVLKVCGTQEFLLERYPICQYKVNKTLDDFA